MADKLTQEDLALFQHLVDHAAEHHDGHLTIYRFTTNWRVGWYTPAERYDIDEATAGKTFREAAKAALAQEAMRLKRHPPNK